MGVLRKVRQEEEEEGEKEDLLEGVCELCVVLCSEDVVEGGCG